MKDKVYWLDMTAVLLHLDKELLLVLAEVLLVMEALLVEVDPSMGVDPLDQASMSRWGPQDLLVLQSDLPDPVWVYL